MTTGQQIQRLRLGHNLTIKEASKAVGISQSAWCMYESDQRIPRDQCKRRIAQLLGASIESLFYPDKHKSAQ